MSELAGALEMKDILPAFVRDLPRRVAEMGAALARGDLVLLRQLARKLKGSAGGYGFPSITAIAFEVEKAAMREEKAHAIRGRIDALMRLATIARASMPPPPSATPARALVKPG